MGFDTFLGIFVILAIVVIYLLSKRSQNHRSPYSKKTDQEKAIDRGREKQNSFQPPPDDPPGGFPND
ncbi:hypothetical protein KO561_14710 [Radiobacillus kanasensis]|uniref:hypothetical protein n=1 Tax=Radiobacillus kanasensis TaxID=2844358 RepID=UPI001E53721B|nr:hypothetical protein [Radiobacillus kanasensis]UFT98438.1 hypothetical protein KO561_14710 [Radiobacillus kanasensis]